MAFGQSSIYEDGLEMNPANSAALSPLSFLERCALVHPSRPSILYKEIRYTWNETYGRCRQMASALQRRGIGRGQTVAVVAPNVPAAYEVHFGVAMAGAVLNSINIRLDPRTMALFFSHALAKLIMVDFQFAPQVRDALGMLSRGEVGRGERDEKAWNPPQVVIIDDPGEEDMPAGCRAAAALLGGVEYEEFLQEGDEKFSWSLPEAEWAAISLNYTSGTTSAPKGVAYAHRGAYVAALSNALGWGMGSGCIYLWTLPLFHCNGWCFPWTVAALAGTNICMRQVTPRAIFDLVAAHKVTHFCGAPIVLNFIINARPQDRQPLPHHPVNVMTAGAAPPPAVLAGMEELGFRVTHAYGLTETYGPCVVNEWKREEWDQLAPEERAKLNARQGVRYMGLEGLDVLDPSTMRPVPPDGRTIGEVMMRGNLVMKGYIRNPNTTQDAFQGGWFHSGDLGVRHPDGYIQLKDRSKDIIISGGENISSIEVEATLYSHVAILEAAVVARPDKLWGETVCAFVSLKANHSEVREDDIIQFCRQRLPHYMAPRSVVITPALPKTSTGKIQKFVLRKQAQTMGSLPPGGRREGHNSRL